MTFNLSALFLLIGCAFGLLWFGEFINFRRFPENVTNIDRILHEFLFLDAMLLFLLAKIYEKGWWE